MVVSLAAHHHTKPGIPEARIAKSSKWHNTTFSIAFPSPQEAWWPGANPESPDTYIDLAAPKFPHMLTYCVKVLRKTAAQVLRGVF